jgi:hypothetical protein
VKYVRFYFVEKDRGGEIRVRDTRTRSRKRSGVVSDMAQVRGKTIP